MGSGMWYDDDYTLVRDRLRSESRKKREELIDGIGPVPNMTLLVAEIVMGWQSPRCRPPDLFMKEGMTARSAFTALLHEAGPDAATRQRTLIPDLAVNLEAVFRYVIPRLVGALDMEFVLAMRQEDDHHLLLPPYIATFGVFLDRDAIQSGTRVAAWMRAQDDHAEMAICKAALKACLWMEKRDPR